MAFFKIGSTDISSYVAGLDITYTNKYNSATNANGNTVIDYLNRKRTIEVEIIPLEDNDMKTLQALLVYNPVISYREPQSGAMVSNIQCVLQSHKIDYYTIQSTKVMYKKLKLKFIEL